MPETPYKRPLTQLNYEIEQAEAEMARLVGERKAVAKDANRVRHRLHYLQLAQWIRRPGVSFEAWPTTAMLVGPAFVGVVLFILVHLILGSFAMALLVFIVSLAGSAALFGALLYRPPDTQLASVLAEAETHCRLQNARLVEKTSRLSEVNERLQRLVEERRDQIASGKLQRAALLQRNWKSMREAEWDDFVVEVCRTLGASVDRLGKFGSTDANLIVSFGSRRIAVLTQAEEHNVSSATIQQALAAKGRHRCDGCGVIINRRFTGAAQDFARRNNCTAIGTVEFPDFALGKIEL